ncbi:hypothetical protein N657DRAFT_635898 [Parathielavia appendiculata]|uniref:RING finger domain-containing protein n=1 Tax=Parathielavia appendiculata TaxID=2587402 RepID=A0AAN6Z280_9PEZI|nr:hypothetical protein N657DRAFT_635898 [Parathielavia appendiculata]
MSRDPDDVPPPPYSEQDLFSASGRDAHVADDTSRSTSSTNGDVIYTPPLTPHSSHHSNFAGEVDHLEHSAAAAYFASRPAPLLTTQPHLVHSITLTRDSTPDSLPFPSHLTGRDVRLEDWQTFANYLMPHYSATSNEQVIDRKLRAETMTATNTLPRSNNSNNDDVRSQLSGRSHAEAQLDRIRSLVEADAAQQRQNAEDTIREWNDGFFAPRRITIRVDLGPINSNYTNSNHASGLNEVPADPEKQPIPGAWDQSFDNSNNNNSPNSETDRNNNNNNNNNNNPPRRGFGSFFNPFASRGNNASANTNNHNHARGGGGFRFGGINVEGDRVSIGNSFVADGRTGSVRIGGIAMDPRNGISINGQPMFGGAAHLHGHTSPLHARRVGSLPDYDDLHDAQLPVAKQCVREWLQHPDQPITKEKVKHVREQIKAAKKSTTVDAAGFDKSALRREVRNLLREWKELKRQQKRTRKQEKRELRQAKREAKREIRRAKREVKRELRQAKKEVKRSQREMHREWRRGPHPPPPHGPPPHGPPPHHVFPPHGPPPPGSFGIPSFPPMPHMPHMPGMPPFPGAWPGGHGDPPHYDSHHHDEGVEPVSGVGYPESQAKYQAAWEMEARVAEKEAELLQLHERIAEEEQEQAQEQEQQHGAAAASDGVDEKEKRKGGQKSKIHAEAEAVEREIEELAREMERLRTEADEEFARALAEEEERRFRG